MSKPEGEHTLLEWLVGLFQVSRRYFSVTIVNLGLRGIQQTRLDMFVSVVGLSLLFAALCSCRNEMDAHPTPTITQASVTSETAEERPLREKARDILSQHCGECHDPRRKTALPSALKIFDLGECEWSVHMSDAQLRDALRRLGEPIPPEGRPNDVSDQERATFQKYVEFEIANRARKAH